MFAGNEFKQEELTPTDYQPFKGVREDLDSILKAFENTGNVRYETFNKLWLGMGFDRFYAGRQNERECRELSEECLRIIMESWSANSGLHTKVGLFYMLYALYFTQPIQPKAKIRITLPVWKDMSSFVGEVKLQKHLDIEYIFHTLRYHQAFHFVASTAWPTLTVRSQANASQLNYEDQSAFREPSAVSEILQPDHIDQLSSIHEHYHRLKCKMAALNGGTPDKPQSSLDFIKTNLVQVITKTVAQHDVWRKTQGRKKPGRKRRDSGQTTTSESDVDSDSDYGLSPGRKSPKETQSQWGIRAEIKDRAQKMVSVPNRGRKSRLVEDSDIGSPATFTPSKKRKGRPPRNDSQTDEEFFSVTEATPIKQEELLSMPTMVEDEEEEDGTQVLNLGSATPVVSLSKTPTPKGRGGSRRGRGRGRKTPSSAQQEKTPARGRGRGKKRAEIEDTPVKEELDISIEDIKSIDETKFEEGDALKKEEAEEAEKEVVKKKGRGKKATETKETPAKGKKRGKRQASVEKSSEAAVADNEETPIKANKQSKKKAPSKMAPAEKEEIPAKGKKRGKRQASNDRANEITPAENEETPAKGKKRGKRQASADKANETALTEKEETPVKASKRSKKKASVEQSDETEAAKTEESHDWTVIKDPPQADAKAGKESRKKTPCKKKVVEEPMPMDESEGGEEVGEKDNEKAGEEVEEEKEEMEEK